MSEEQWAKVDEFITDSVVPADERLSAAVTASEAGGLPAIQVSRAQAEFLSLLVRMLGAKRVLEVGTLGGFSTIAMARELPPDGHLLTMEADSHHADVASQSIASAGLAGVVEVRRGAALDTFARLAESAPPSFDLFFIDADKEHNPDYFNWAVRLSHPGSVIVVDNVVRGGGVLDANSPDAAIQGTRRLYEVVGNERRVTATAIQTVGNKGYDGFLIARVN